MYIIDAPLQDETVHCIHHVQQVDNDPQLPRPSSSFLQSSVSPRPLSSPSPHVTVPNSVPAISIDDDVDVVYVPFPVTVIDVDDVSVPPPVVVFGATPL
jgi:hypothetical protein